MIQVRPPGVTNRPRSPYVALLALLTIAGAIGTTRTEDGWFIGDLMLGWVAGLILWPLLLCCMNFIADTEFGPRAR